MIEGRPIAQHLMAFTLFLDPDGSNEPIYWIRGV
jgi:hypothetical protein